MFKKGIKFLFFISTSLLIKCSLCNTVNKVNKKELLQADLIIFSYQRPLQLYALLESVEQRVRALKNIFVIYRADDAAFQAAYVEVKGTFSNVKFYRQENPPLDFKPLLLDIAFKQSKTKFILFAVDDNIVTDFIDISECIELMETAKAYAFFLRLGKNINHAYMYESEHSTPGFNRIKPGVFSWILSKGRHVWRYVHNVDMTIYRKSKIKEMLETMNYATPNQLDDEWTSFTNKYWLKQYKKRGLCFKNPKIVNIPINLVQENKNAKNMQLWTPQQLLEAFNRGLKFDINKIFRLKYATPHIEFIPSFISRVPYFKKK